jgi:hypothetical protein
LVLRKQLLFIDGLEPKYGAVRAMDGALYNYVTGHNSRHSSEGILNNYTKNPKKKYADFLPKDLVVMIDFYVWFRFREFLVKRPKILDFSSDSCWRRTTSDY